jgi:O-antigen biosynthesis protein
VDRPGSRTGERPTLTVAVCTRNRPDPLADCIESLLQLDPPADEILVIDQSDPEVAIRVGELCRPPIRHLPTETRGQGAARQTALEAATSEVLAFTDDDCRVRRNWAAAIRAAFGDHPEAGAVTGSVRPLPGDLRLPGLPDWVYYAGEEEPRVYRGRPDPIDLGAGLNMAFQTRAIRQVGGFDPLLGPGARLESADDADALNRILRAGFALVYTPEAVVSHHPPRDAAGHWANERVYARGYAAWVAKCWLEGDRLPWTWWRRTFFRNLRNLVLRAHREGPWRSVHRLRVAWYLLLGLRLGTRAYRSARAAPEGDGR